MAPPPAGRAQARRGAAGGRTQRLVAPRLLLLLAVAAAAALRPASGRGGGGVVPGEFVVFYKEGETAIADATDRLRESVASRLVADAAAAAAAQGPLSDLSAGAGPGAAAAATSSALARPFTTAYATPYVLDPRGRAVPGAHAIVRLHPRLVGAGGGAGAAAAAARVVELIKADPRVAFVVEHLTVDPDGGLEASAGGGSGGDSSSSSSSGGSGGGFTAAATRSDTPLCGPGWKAKAACASGGAAPCCGASSGVCGSTCGDDCMADWSSCGGPTLPRQPFINSSPPKLPNMVMIEASAIDPVTKKLMTPTAGDSSIQVMVIDGGVGPHSAIKIGGCRNFNPDTTDAQHDGRTECYDSGRRHGTHVAGIVAARPLIGGKSYGVLPGVKIFSARVESLANQQFSLAGCLEALRYVIATGNSDNVAVVNMSWSRQLDQMNADQAQFAATFCAAVAEIQATWGTVFVAAAGNDGTPLLDFAIPRTTCPDILIVTNIDTCKTKSVASATYGGARYTQRRCTPSSTSNWVASDGPDGWKARTLAGPGTNVMSTFPYGGYGVFSGTSMSSPAIAGVAARCFVSGDCTLGSSGSPSGSAQANNAKVIAAAQLRGQDPAYAWTGGPGAATWTTPAGEARWYGPMAWAGRW